MNAPAPARARIRMRCPNCGSDAICKDAWAAWDETNQRWELGGVYDNETCIQCEHEGDDHFDRIAIETNQPLKPRLDEGLPANCISNTGHAMEPHPHTGIPYCRHCCPLERMQKTPQVPSKGH